MKLAIFLAAVAFAACGPSNKQVRQYMMRSPHRTVAIFPLDRNGGDRDVTAQAESYLENKLRGDGFIVTGRGKTQVVYSSSTLRGRELSETAQAVQLSRAWKVSAVLLGQVSGAYERVEKIPEEDRFDPVPPPACCANAKNPCGSAMAWDALLKTHVLQCGGWHKKVVIMPAQSARIAGMSVRLCLVDAATQKILWETTYDTPREYGTLPQLADKVTDVLVDQLSQAYMQQLL